ncbi:MAG TPA: hypothetical protein VKE88_00025 [Candidatus Nanoarchaeia archaeon]|nr:hypothetical protein [Candidatus Nanoarchaeia archaeon]
MPRDQSSNEAGKYFVQEFVVGLGLLSGMGIDPEGTILQAFIPLIKDLSPGLVFLFSILPYIVTLLSLWGAYEMGRELGILAVSLAFISGLILPNQFGAWLLAISFILGLFAPSFAEDHPQLFI